MALRAAGDQPFVLTAAQATELVELARAKKLFLMEGELHSVPALLYLGLAESEPSPLRFGSRMDTLPANCCPSAGSRLRWHARPDQAL